MLIKNVLKKTAAIVGLDIDLDAENAALQKEVASLLEYADIVYNEIVADYFPLLCEEELYFDPTGCAELSGLGKNPLHIVSLRSGGANIKYTLFPSRIFASDAKNVFLTVRYAYIPDRLTGIDDEVAGLLNVTERMFALGVAAEYCLANGMLNESLLYDRRFKDAMQSAARKRGEIKIKRRRWIK
ncbi:MAG: hypothetical protein LBQ40_01120 [Clostridiales bacterium]|jgi:hypothetical protein|nr:hypothetical protein [Clostridiales bacterium]